MKVITGHNEKGGVGKSTITIHLAAGLAVAGHTVIFIDADPQQANATALMGLPQTPALYDLIVRDAAWESQLLTVSPDLYTVHGESKGELLWVSSNHETSTITNHQQDPYSVLYRLEELDGVDYVVIDTSPAPTGLNGYIFSAADTIIFTTQCEPASLQGLAGTTKRMAKFINTRASRGLGVATVAAIVPTMYQSNTIAHQEGLKQLQGAFGDRVLSPIARRIVWADASGANRTVWAYDPLSPAAAEGWNLVDEVTARLEVSA